jgi:hypothetical protein
MEDEKHPAQETSGVPWVETKVRLLERSAAKISLSSCEVELPLYDLGPHSRPHSPLQRQLSVLNHTNMLQGLRQVLKASEKETRPCPVLVLILWIRRTGTIERSQDPPSLRSLMWYGNIWKASASLS